MPEMRSREHLNEAKSMAGRPQEQRAQAWIGGAAGSHGQRRSRGARGTRAGVHVAAWLGSGVTQKDAEESQATAGWELLARPSFFLVSASFQPPLLPGPRVQNLSSVSSD